MSISSVRQTKGRPFRSGTTCRRITDWPISAPRAPWGCLEKIFNNCSKLMKNVQKYCIQNICRFLLMWKLSQTFFSQNVHVEYSKKSIWTCNFRYFLYEKKILEKFEDVRSISCWIFQETYMNMYISGFFVWKKSWKVWRRQKHKLLHQWDVQVLFYKLFQSVLVNP